LCIGKFVIHRVHHCPDILVPGYRFHVPTLGHIVIVLRDLLDILFQRLIIVLYVVVVLRLVIGIWGRRDAGYRMLRFTAAFIIYCMYAVMC
jgi:hypothetical protein